MAKEYDVFISYSHRADATVARTLEVGLKNMGRRWNERRALEVFRDEASLSASPHLWQTLADRLDSSRYAVVLLSPEAAESQWVNQEIEHFLGNHDEETLLLALTAGTIEWDNQANGWTDDSTAVPPNLRGRLTAEPCWVDLRWAREINDLDVRDTRFRGAVATLAAPVHGLSKDELEGEDIRQHRRFVRLRRGAVGALVLLVFALGVASIMALNSATTARNALQDLEDANGSIDELEIIQAELRAANDEAADKLLLTQAAQAEAEDRATTAEQLADEAELAQREAEALQREADVARLQAVRDREAADAVAADARANERDALAAEATARDSAARALAGENAAKAAAAEATQRQAQATAAANAAQQAADRASAAEKVARDAEANALALKTQAEDLQRQAEASAQAAVTAQLAAEELERQAKAAAFSATLSAASAESVDPAVSSLLAVESYCAVNTCDAPAPAALALTESGSAVPSALAIDSPSPDSLSEVVTMAQAIERHQGYLGTVPGWSGIVSDVAISGDGSTVAVLGTNNKVMVWNRFTGATRHFDNLVDAVGYDSPCAECAEDREVTGLELNSDGTRLAFVTAGFAAYDPDSGRRGLSEVLHVVDPQRTPLRTIDSAVVRFDVGWREDAPVWIPPPADISFSPSTDDVLLVASDSVVVVRDRIFGGPDGDGDWSPTVGQLATNANGYWEDDQHLLLIGKTLTGPVMRFNADDVRAGRTEPTETWPLELSWSPTTAPLGIVPLDGGTFVAWSDGTMGRLAAEPQAGSPWPLIRAGQTVGDLRAVTPGRGSRELISLTGDSVYRISFESNPYSPSGVGSFAARLVGEKGTERSAIDVASFADDPLIVTTDGRRVELRTLAAGSSGRTTPAPERPNMVVSSTAGGHLLRTRPAGPGPAPFTWVTAQGRTISLGTALSAAASADGSTLVTVLDDRTSIDIRVEPYDDVIHVALPPGLEAEPPPSNTRLGPTVAVSPDGSVIGVMAADGPMSLRLLLYHRDGRRLDSGVPITPVCRIGNPRGPTSEALEIAQTSAVVRIEANCGVREVVDYWLDFSAAPVRDPIAFRMTGDSPVPKTLALSDSSGLLRVPLFGATVERYPADGSDSSLAVPGSGDGISALEVNGPVIVTGHFSGRVRMWIDGVRAIDFQPQNSSVVEISMAVVDGVPTLATLDSVGTVVRRDLSSSALRRELCAMAGRDLSAAEWSSVGGVGAPPTCARGLD